MKRVITYGTYDLLHYGHINLLQRAKALIPILIPLFVSAFMRAGELATAMECRCYHGGDGRTRMKQLRMTLSDYVAVVVMIVVVAAMVLTNQAVPAVI